MKTFTTTINLMIDAFDAENENDAERIINEYLDVLAEIAPASLTWSCCDWTPIEEFLD